MNTGPVVAVALVITQSGCFSQPATEYIATYKDLQTCEQRTEKLKQKHPGDVGLRKRYCALVGVVQEPLE